MRFSELAERITFVLCHRGSRCMAQPMQLIMSSDRIGLCATRPLGVHILANLSVGPYVMLYARNVFIASTAVTLEIQGSTQAPVLRRGGKTTSGLAPGVGRVKSTGSCKIHKPLPFCPVVLEGAFHSMVPQSKGLGR